MRRWHVLIILFITLLMGSPTVQAQRSTDAQGVTRTDTLGGQVTTTLPLGDGTLLAAVGDQLLRLQPDDDSFRPRGEYTIGRGTIVDMVLSEGALYVLTSSGVALIDATTFDIRDFFEGGGQGLALSQRHVAVAAREAGYRLFERTASGGLVRIDPIGLDGAVDDVTFSPDGLRLYLATTEGVRVLNLPLADPPAFDAEPFTLLPAQAVAVSGPLVTVASEQGRVQVYDATTRTQIGEYAPLQKGEHITVQGEYAYVIDAIEGLKIFFLAAPDRPIQIYNEGRMPAVDMRLDGDIAVIVGGHSLRILDTANRYQPLVLGQLAFEARPLTIALGGGRAFVGLEGGGIAVVNVENRSQPLLEATLFTAADVEAMHYYDGWLYTVHSDNIFYAFDPSGNQSNATVPLGCPPSDIDQRGQVLYVACGENGIIAVDVLRRGQPTIVGTVAPNSGDVFTQLDITGKRAYVAGGDHVTVIDINRPQQMGRLARADVEADAIAHSDRYFYALGENSITVYNVRFTSEPLPLRRYGGITRVASMVAAGRQVFISNAADGADMVALSLLTPASPYEVANVGTRGMSFNVTANSEAVWLARGFAGFQQFMITEGAPIQTGAYTTPPDVERITTDGERIAAGGLEGWATALWLNEAGLQAGTTSDASTAVRDLRVDEDTLAVAFGGQGIGLYEAGEQTAYQPSVGAAAGITMDESIIYVADAAGLALYDRRFLTPITRVATEQPALGLMLYEDSVILALADGSVTIVDVSQPRGGVASTALINTRRPNTLIPSGEFIYAVSENGVLKLDLSDPTDIDVVAQSTLPAISTEAFFADDLLAVYREGSAVTLYDIRDLGNSIREVGSFAAGGVDVALRESTAYVAYGDGGLGLVDIRQTGEPRIFEAGAVNDVLIDGDRLYALGDIFRVWDISTPPSPQLISEVEDIRPGRHMAVTVDGRLLLGLEDGISVVEGQSITGRIGTPGAVTHVQTLGAWGFAALERGGVLMFDLQTLTPLFTLSSPMGQFANSIQPVDDGHVLISWDEGLEVIEVTDVTDGPRVVTTLPAAKVGLTPQGGRFAQDGALAAMSTGVASTVLLDLDGPTVVSSVPTPGDALGVALEGDVLYVADGACGMRVIDVSQREQPQEIGYWRGNFVSDVTAFGGGQVVIVDAGQLVSLRYDADAEAVLPDIPQNPAPPDNAANLPGQAQLMWGPPADPCNPLSYRIYLGVAEDPPLIGRVAGNPLLVVSDLGPSRTYNWRVEATDRQGDTVSGPAWQFSIAQADFEGGPPAPPTFVQRLLQNPLIPISLVVLLGAISFFTFRYVRKRQSIR